MPEIAFPPFELIRIDGVVYAFERVDAEYILMRDVSSDRIVSFSHNELSDLIFVSCGAKIYLNNL